MNFLIRGSDYLSLFEGFELIGRDAELERLTSILMRRRASSVILVGAGGVGCTALCIGVQVAKNKADAPFDLVSKRLFWLDSNGLFATGEGDALRQSFQKIIDRLKRTPSSVLIIDDARDFIESCRNAGTLHFVSALTGAVAAGLIQVIIETKDDDLDALFRCHSDIRELFTVLPIDEPTGDSLLAIVHSAARHLSRHHGIHVNDEAVTTAIDLTNKYHSRDSGLARSQPERAVTLIDRALAAYRLSVHRHPPGYTQAEWEARQTRLRALYANQRDGEVEITRLEDEMDEHHQRLSEQGQRVVTGNALDSFATPEENAIRDRIRMIQAEVDKSKKEFQGIAAEINASLELTRDLVLAEFSDISGIPASKLNQDEIEKLRGLESLLSQRIFGQGEVIAKVANGIKIARVGRRNANKPLASFLFLGPSGVGKSATAQGLAAALLDDEAALTRFDMSEYMEKHAVAKMIGAPPGYEGFEAGGILTNAMRKNAYRVLLFDEIEKAHPDIFNIFLQILDDGRLTDNIGRTVSFSDSVIVMTTNIGQPQFLDSSLTMEEAEQAALDDLGHAFRSELLNRFAGRQNILCFKQLGLDSIQKIVRREIAALDRVYGEKGVHIEIADTQIMAFCEDQYDPKVGARGLPGFLSVNLEPVIVNTILENPELRGTARVVYNRDNRRFDVEI